MRRGSRACQMINLVHLIEKEEEEEEERRRKKKKKNER
jgi:hypothetical protein